jgi:hypothetical protein
MSEMQTLSSDLFSYSAASRFLGADVSDLHEQLGSIMPKQIAIRSQRTGDVKQFVLRDTIRNIENETLFWVYHNQDLGLSVRIYND